MVVRFIDKPVDTDSGVFAAATAVCAKSQPFLPKHFPGFPIVPGVLIVDTCFEAICDAARENAIVPPDCHLEIDGIDGFKFRDCIFPDDVMGVSCELRKQSDSLLEFRCIVSVNDKAKSTGRLTLRVSPTPEFDGNFELATPRFSEAALKNWEWFSDFEEQLRMETAHAKFSVTPELFANYDAQDESCLQFEYPTVLLIEGLAQASVQLTCSIRPAGFQTTFGMVRYARVLGTARVGDDVEFELLVMNPDPRQFQVRGRAVVRDETILETEVVLGFTPLSHGQSQDSESQVPVEPVGAV